VIVVQAQMTQEFQNDIYTISNIHAVPTILEVVCRSTGMRFAAVARVTERRWVACSVLDEIDFGLKPGDELRIESTICNEIRQSRQSVIIEHVAEEPDWCNHVTPATYGFQSYISMPIILADGSFFGTLCAIDPLPAQIKTAATIGMFRLFAELIAKHLDGAKKLAEVERSNEALQRFAAIASHDLREPLRQVSIFTQLLVKKQKPLDTESQKYFDFVEAGTARMGKLLDGLMEYTQLDAASSTPLQTADIEAALNEALKGLALSLHESGAIVTRDSLPQVHGNPSQLAELLQNLISNALKYRGKETPRIHVSAARQENAWLVSVRDNGIGISTEHRKKIFEAFARLHGREIEGTGLGLAFCAKVIELHGGRIWAEANVDATNGCTFCFTLPA
jgi:signal transduction histidine kinase